MDPNSVTATRLPSRADTVGIWAFMVAGTGIVAWAVVGAVLRITDALSSPEVRVLAEFAGTPAEAPIGPGGAPVAIELDRAFLFTDELPGPSLVALVLSEIAFAVSVAAVVACLLLLSASTLRGRVFSRRNTRLVATAGTAGLVGAAAVPFLANMVANGAFARISDGEFDNVLMSVDLMPFVLAAFVVAIITTAFAVGERLQRDTEGLV
ncbi:hypothetical protein ACFPER_01535 [Agromyces aurantiacus]|uniref:DUF2975 domain-containing protein n=1 Tax=Agromyces aurantiacus TaxID=165814 RepID=A0ABV9R0S6_9MICO|nr:hypothetical protein [Agromyces aurantiacus]MBM7505769.1 hypothetical protein [Agromyces aurantiacus]